MYSLVAGHTRLPTRRSSDLAVIFSKAVTGFGSGGVTITGTAGGTKTVTVTGTGTTYNVAVTGMTSTGTVIASVTAGAAAGTAGHASAPQSRRHHEGRSALNN